jgi:hypothetical protein
MRDILSTLPDTFQPRNNNTVLLIKMVQCCTIENFYLLAVENFLESDTPRTGMVACLLAEEVPEVAVL